MVENQCALLNRGRELAQRQGLDASRVTCWLTDPSTCDGRRCPFVAPVRPFINDTDAFIQAVEAVKAPEQAKFLDVLERHEEIVAK